MQIQVRIPALKVGYLRLPDRVSAETVFRSQEKYDWIKVDQKMLFGHHPNQNNIIAKTREKKTQNVKRF